jgi:hypothetical protein
MPHTVAKRLLALLWLSIPSGFLVVVEKPNRGSFTIAYHALKELGEYDASVSDGGSAPTTTPCSCALGQATTSAMPRE